MPELTPAERAQNEVIMNAIVARCKLAKKAIAILNDAGVAAEQLTIAAATPENVTPDILAMTDNLASLQTTEPHAVASVIQEFVALLEGNITIAEGVTIKKKVLLLRAAAAVRE